MIIFLLSLLLIIKFNNKQIDFQFIYYINWITSYNLTLTLGVDGISLFFILLTTFIIPLCILINWNIITFYEKEFLLLLFLIEFFLLIVFTALNLFLFYLFFEAILIPMFIVIGIWGSRRQKIQAAYQFFLYTLIGSVLMLLGILTIYSSTGTTDLIILKNIKFSETRELLLWISLFASFAVKIPMLPVHIWLPQAHVEAPTAGSVILAALLLKLGGYGFLRFSLPLFPYASMYFTPLIYTISIIGIIYSSCTTIRQIDLKRIIAYSSVAHMNFATLGLFSNTIQGIEGSLLLMLSHGFVSTGLSIGVGFLYDRYKTRLLYYYGGIIYIMPILGIYFLLFTIANIAFPGTSSFVGEMLILMGVFQNNSSVAFLANIGMILSGIYGIWLYNRIFFYKIKNIKKYYDLNKREFFIMLPLLIIILILGIKPLLISSFLQASIITIINQIK